jgi:hypothetical protein
MRPRLLLLALTVTLFSYSMPLHAADVKWPAKLGSSTDSGSIIRFSDPPENGDPLLHESGLLTVTSRTYALRGHRVDLNLYTFRDSSGAFEALSLVRSRVAGKDESSFRTIYASNLILNVISPDSALDPEMVSAATKWVQSVSDGVAAPPIADYLPAKNQSMALYALGPVGFRRYADEIGSQDIAALAGSIGFDSHAEAMWAKYKSGKDEATLLLIDYPTPQLAELHLRHLQRALADAKLTTSSVERKGSLLSIVLAPTSPEYAAKLRASVNYETQVTWNEASQVATDPPILSTVAKIFIATGVFMVVTLVIGIAFGGVRIITKRLFPGKVFDRKDQIEVLQLGLSGKPIDPSDMY